MNDSTDSYQYTITVPRPLAEKLADHYDGDREVRSIPDALRRAGRDVLREAMEGQE